MIAAGDFFSAVLLYRGVFCPPLAHACSGVLITGNLLCRKSSRHRWYPSSCPLVLAVSPRVGVGGGGWGLSHVHTNRAIDGVCSLFWLLTQSGQPIFVFVTIWRSSYRAGREYLGAIPQRLDGH